MDGNGKNDGPPMATIPGGCQNAEPSEKRLPWRFRAEDSARPALGQKPRAIFAYAE